MAGKKKQLSKGEAKSKQPEPEPKKTHGEKAANGSKHQQTKASSGGISIWLCVFAAALSFALGIISPPLLDLWRGAPTTNAPTRRTLATSKITPGESTTMTKTFPCDEAALSQYWHKKPVPGMHIVCMDSSAAEALTVTFFPGTQKTQTPRTETYDKLPTLAQFRNSLVSSLQLRKMDDVHQPWAVYSPIGELLLKEDSDEEQVQMQVFTQTNMVLVYQGGQFIWPGVEIGFKRTIDLYTVMPAGSPPMDGKTRTATLETISLQPLVFSVEGFLDVHECNFIQEQATPTLAYSSVTLMDKDAGRPASDFRTSQSTFLAQKNHPIIKDIDYRTASLVRVPRNHQEQCQVLRYEGGEKYDAHHDYFDPALYKNDQNTLKYYIQYGRRNRMATVFWYLSDVPRGGETIFPRFNNKSQPRSMQDCSVGLKVKPVRGKVIIFYSLKPDGSLDPLSLHGACPVEEGIKWAANKWVWNLPIEFGSGN